MTSITILTCIYFFCNGFFVGLENDNFRFETRINSVLFRLFWAFFGLPYVVCTVVLELVKEAWIWFSNKTGAGFYWKFYVLREYDNLTQKELENAEYRKNNLTDNPIVKKWGEKILRHNNYQGRVNKESK